MPRRQKRLLPLLVRTALLGLPTALVAPVAAAQEAQQNHTFDIPAGPLSTALTQIAAQAGVQLTADAGLTTNRNAPALAGTMTLQQALDRVLAGSGLRASVEGTDVVVREGGEAMLRAVKVRADGFADEAVGSYRAAAVGIGRSAGGVKEIPQAVSVVTRQRLDDQNLHTVVA
jgi:hypothetical protein